MKRAWHALVAYLALAVVATWPLALGLSRDVPADLGDPVFVMWVLAWDCQQLLAILSGDVSRVATFFDANIFHPAPQTLAYSEHFIAQALQVLPVWALTGNPILCYNLLFLATFVLSGFGTYLFVRELTGDSRAAFVAGVLFAFAPYRFPQSPHLQVLSSQWMPFALFGLRRYFLSIDTAAGHGRWLPLAGTVAALVAQNLSCTYYLMFFSPFVAAYVVWEIWQRSLWQRTAVWLRLCAAGLAVAALTVPFLLPYVLVQRHMGVERSIGELSRYAADVYSYATASPSQVLWGEHARAFPKPEGDLFPGITTVLLAALGIIMWRPGPDGPGQPRLSRTVTVLLVIAVLHLLAIVACLLYRRLSFDIAGFTLRISNVDQLVFRILLITGVALFISPALRAHVGSFMRSRGLFVVGLIATAWLSLGPAPQALGRPLNLSGLYTVLYDYVPGFDGLRVPARFAMIGTLMLAVLGGFGAAALSRWRAATVILVVLSAVALAESVVYPFPINGVGPLREYNVPEARVYRPARAPDIYHRLAQESNAILAELPIGQPDYDIRAMFYSLVHRARLLNGYSGFFPPHYGLLALTLSDVPSHASAAWQALRDSGTSHVIVHEGAWLDDRGPKTTAALVELGASELFREGSDVLLKLP